MGSDHYGAFLLQQRDQPGTAAAREACRKAATAVNFQPQVGMPPAPRFDVFHFDKADAQRRLNMAFASAASTGHCKKVFTSMQGPYESLPPDQQAFLRESAIGKPPPGQQQVCCGPRCLYLHLHA